MVAEFTSNLNVNVNPNPETPTPSALEENDLTKKQPLTPQPSLQEKIDWLLALGLSPLPVAPAQDAQTYPARDKKGAIIFDAYGNPKPQFTGKNPSYLDVDGTPHPLSHKPYQKRQPTQKELATWFANPKNGVGSLGSDQWVFIDLDRPKFDVPGIGSDEAQAACDEAGKMIIEAIVSQTQKLPPYERTQSLGWRMVVGLSSPPTFTNFAMKIGGDHVGEILGKGRFAVLAPTVGPSGNAYEAYHRCDIAEIPVIDALEQLPFVPVKASRGRPKKVPTPLTPPSDSSTPTSDSSNEDVSTSAPKTVTSTATSTLEKYPELRDKVFELRDLGTDKTRNVLAGINDKGDRSHSLTTAVRDWYGWENWCNANGIAYRGDTRSLALEAGVNLKLEDVEERVDRILAGIDGTSCLTSCEFKGGNDEGCWKRIFKLAGVKVKKPRLTYTVQPSSLNAKVIPLPTATPIPKAVGGNDNSPPKPPNYGGGRGGNNPSDNEVDWRPPEPYKGQLGYWKYPKNDEPYFDAKCNFDFVVVKEFERYAPEGGEPTDDDGGGLQLKVARASDGKTKTVLITSQEYATAKSFTAALKKRLGIGVKCRISDYDLTGLLETKLFEYHRKGGKIYTLASAVGEQPDGVRVFPNLQISANGTPLNESESPWVFNPRISEVDYIPSPDIPVNEDPNALRVLLEAQREFAQANFMRFLLANGWVVASLHEQEIMRLEKFKPVFNPYGDAGTAKTIAMESALSLIWGDSGNGMISSTSVSMAYERLARTGSIPCCWDDPPSKDKKACENLDEFVKRQYNKFPRLVRGNVQKPLSSMAITSNHCVGETLPATATRIVGVFFPTVTLNKDAYRRLRQAMAKAPDAFRSLLRIGYNQMAVHETRKRLIPHLQKAHDRAADNWALIVWYAQKVVELAGMDIDVEAWVVENICPTLNEEQKGLNSAADFISRLLALHTQNQAGTWNAKVITNRTHGECLALDLKTLWAAIERSGDSPSYNLKLLESVLVSKGCVRGVSTKFHATRDGVLNYLRELGKGANQGEGWIPPTPPPQVSKRALLIPKRLWDEFNFDPDALAPPPDDDGEWDGESSSYTPVTSSYSELRSSVTSSNADVVSASDSSSTSSYKHTKNKLEERESVEQLVEEVSVGEKTINPPNVTEEKISASEFQNFVTSVTGKNSTPETSTPQGLDLVTNEVKLDETSALKNVTSAKTDAQTPDDNLIKLGQLATEMIHCASQADVEKLYASHSTEAIEAAKELLGDEERLTFEAIVNACANLSPAVVEVAQADIINKDAAPSTVGTRFRYVGTLTHKLKDAEGNLITDAEGKPLVLSQGSELVLEEVERSVNDDYATVRPISLNSQTLGIRRSQLEEISNG
jgi:hypothetical protein